MPWRAWTTKEVGRLKELRACNFTQAECALELGRTLSSVRSQAYRSGIHQSQLNPGRIRRAIRRWNPRGWSDTRIARRLGVCQATVSDHRRQMGLPVVPRRPTPESDRRRAEARERCWASAALAAAWPPVPAGQRRILEALEALGGSGSVAQVNALNGTRYVGCRGRPWLELVAFGFVVIVSTTTTRHGGIRGSRPLVFILAEDVAERRRRHLNKAAIAG